MEQFNLNTIPGKVAPVCNASQYDTGRTIRVNLFEGSQVYTLDGTEVISVSVRKPDGHIVTEGVTNTSAEYVEIVTTEQMTACAGDNLCELKIEKGGDVIGTLNFILRVELDPLAGGDPSESFVYNLQTQIAAAVADQYDSNAVIFDAAPVVGHGVGFVVTSEGVKNYVDASIGGLSIPEDLDDLNDVETTAPAQGEALVWDGTKWVNGTVSTVGNLDDLSDVDTTGKQEGDSLRYIGGEWKAKPTVIEMTQAEYDAIVDFTPYANTHIVITDAPNLNPTASDIEYTSGVSVADKLDTIPTVTATTDTANGKRLSGGYIQIGNIVYVDINIELLSQTDYTKALQTGLPTPIDNKNVQIIGNNYDTWDYQPNAVLYGFRLANGGVYHNVNSPMASGTKLHIFGSYICES